MSQTKVNFDIRQINRKNVLSYIYSQQSTTQKEIKDTLHLSRSTIVQIIKELEEEQLILRGEILASTGGRPATSLCFNPNSKISIGIELLIDHYEITAMNLYGETVKYDCFSVPYQNTDSYYSQVCKSAKQLITSVTEDSSKILGVGIVLQGLISTDGSQVTYGKILGCTGLTTESFSRHLPYPCLFFHDAEAATADELWQSPNLCNAIYIHIRSNMSGAIIVNRESLTGTELKSGVFEHMTIVPEGNLCYCGNRGCLDAYCSINALLASEETLQSFFQELRTGNKSVHKRWTDYLQYLALAINNLHMFMDCPIILGGTIARYLQGSDLKQLHQLVQNITAFPTDRAFIKVTCCPDSPISRGAALYFVKKHLYSLLGNDTFF